MFTLRIEHAVTDFETWEQAFARFAPMRTGAGVRSHVVRRPVDDPAYVLVDLDFDTREEAAAFLEILRDRVWAVPDNSPALVGSPSTRIAEIAEIA